MSDNRRRYRAIKRALKQLYPKEPTGNLARHLNTLAALVSGIVGGKSVNLSSIGWRQERKSRQKISSLDQE